MTQQYKGNAKGYYDIHTAEGKIQGTDHSLAKRSGVHFGKWKSLVDEGGGSRQYAWDKAAGKFDKLWRSWCFRKLN